MKKILTVFLFIILFFFFLIYFFPKESAYNYLEQELKKHKVIISDEIRNEGVFDFSISEAKVFFEGINVSKINKINFATFIVFSKIEVKDVKLLESISNIAPSPINTIILEHSILDFDKVKISSKGSFGEINGHIDILNRMLFLELKANTIMKSKHSNILREMKLKEGRYYYEFKF